MLLQELFPCPKATDGILVVVSVGNSLIVYFGPTKWQIRLVTGDKVCRFCFSRFAQLFEFCILFSQYCLQFFISLHFHTMETKLDSVGEVTEVTEVEVHLDQLVKNRK
jgi:hypothetical protein